jgi:hypothetical protein
MKTTMTDPPGASPKATPKTTKKGRKEEPKSGDVDPPVVNPAKSYKKNQASNNVKSVTTKTHKVNKSGLEENGPADGKKSKKEEPIREKNPDFKDVETTGRWGAISKTEVIIVSTLVIIIAVVVVVAVIVFLGGNDNDDGDDEPAGSFLGGQMSNQPSNILTPPAQMELILSALNDHPLTKTVWDDRGDDVTTNPYRMAAAWIVDDDTIDTEADILSRFALAVIYYAMGGHEWINSKGWLVSTPVCDGWFGVSCDFRGNVVEIELRGNNLTGQIPDAFVLIPTLQALWLGNNKIEGQLSDSLFPAMPNLEFLYIQNNNLNGPIPDNLTSNGGKLRKYCGLCPILCVYIHCFDCIISSDKCVFGFCSIM